MSTNLHARIEQLEEELAFEKRVTKAACKMADDLAAQLAREAGKTAEASELHYARKSVAGAIGELLRDGNARETNLLKRSRRTEDSGPIAGESIAKRVERRTEKPSKINYPLGGR